MKSNNLRKVEFWDSDCFVEKELTRIWKQYHPEEGREGQEK